MFGNNIKLIILQQSRGGIKQLDARILLIKPYISYDSDFPFDRVKHVGYVLYSLHT
jgi:hypothetical protein